MKDWFIEEVENICERYAGGNFERREAFQMLVRLGFDPHEAQELLNEAAN
jgi:Holliday junction resolvasome RuvABC DNA-binding subunit